jgi:hypothetical protein
VDFSIRVLGNATNVGGTCDSSGSPTASCDVAAGSDLFVNFYLNTLPGELPNGYEGVAFRMVFSGLTVDPGLPDFSYWPPCGMPAHIAQATEILAGCAMGIGEQASTYTGLMAQVKFTCTGSGDIALMHNEFETAIQDPGGSYHEAAGTSESISINCVEPQALPGDTDGDGCPDMREQGINAMMGGARNFLNPWDFFDPDGDGMHRITDISLVNSFYGMDEGVSPYYTQDVDRTLLGPSDWNLGPPDGMVRIVDITHAVKSYGHDCP